MDRRMLVIAGIATAALALAGCGDSNDPTDNAAQAAPVTDEVDATVGTEGVGSDHSDRDKTLYFNRSDASRR
jgi:alpha-D-ribose 1-methylphosphonate 5-triphosphate diphosphatase PhnM